MQVCCVLAASDQLGEGPCWSPGEQRLYWFDIKGKRLSWYAPATATSGSFDLPWRASAAVPRIAGGLLMATEAGLAHFDPRTGEVALWQSMELGTGFRTNDGKVGTDGAFWWSTMDDNGGERPGAVYRTAADGKTERMLDGIHIPNTISMSSDGRCLYLADSKLQTIWAYNAADLSERREFANTRGQSGSPDGSAVDQDGYLWNAQWGGWRVVRYAPDGSIDRVIETPVEQPTSCAFGGENLSTLFITSAWDGLQSEARQRQPLAGGLFALETGVKGLALPLFEG